MNMIIKTMARYIKYNGGDLQNVWVFGNIINFGDYRDTKTFIIGKDNIPVKNPDYSELGYLTIPLEITKHLDNAYDFYKDIITDENQPSIFLDLKPNDGWIVENFGEMPSNWEIVLLYSWGQFDYLQITYPDKTMKKWTLENTLDDMIEYLKTIKEPKLYFKISYRIEGKENVDQHYSEYDNINLPIGWEKQTLVIGGGYNYVCGDDIFHGCESNYLKALINVKKYFNDCKKIKISEPSKNNCDFRYLQLDNNVNEICIC